MNITRINTVFCTGGRLVWQYSPPIPAREFSNRWIKRSANKPWLGNFVISSLVHPATSLYLAACWTYLGLEQGTTFWVLERRYVHLAPSSGIIGVNFLFSGREDKIYWEQTVRIPLSSEHCFLWRLFIWHLLHLFCSNLKGISTVSRKAANNQFWRLNFKFW